MMVVGSRYATSGLKLVDISGTDPFYCITQFKNQNLINEIDDVLHEIMLDEPSFEGNLRAKYFNHESISSMPLYTKEELKYIKNLGTIKVKLIQDQHPSCYMENGETKGIWAEVIKLLSQKSGINIVLEGGDVENYSQETYKDFMNDGYLLLHTQNALQYMSDLEDTILSNSITNVSISYVKRKVAFVEDEYVSHIIALTKDLAYLEPMLLEENPDYEIQYFDDAKSCFEALTDKKVGVVIQNTHRASYLMQKPEFSDKLTVVPGVDHGNNVCLVASEEQQMLIDIINKAIHHITYDEINEIVKRELLMSPYPLENSDFFYQNWKWMIVVVLILLFAIIGYGIFTNKLADAKIQRREFEILQKKAREDEITGLYNRSYFYEEAEKLIKESNELFYIISMNICNFKVVNEHYGMSAGDRLLKEIGAQLQKLDVNQRIIFARFMIDNYYMCIPKSEFEKIELPKNFKTFLDDIDVRVVYGVFLAEDKEMPVNVMCDRAIEATRNKNYTYTEYIHFYDDNVRKQAQLEQEVESEMEQALAERQFFIVVQPKYDSITESIVGGETLVRWQHPQKGLVSPGVFINIFERNGFIDPLDHFVWEETCRFQSELKKKGIKTVPISINVSRIHFYGSELRGQFRELIEKYDLEPQDIELEITESLCSEDSGKIFDTIRELQADGFRIAMDDFGSGYSSLNMLKEMPLDIIKLDLKLHFNNVLFSKLIDCKLQSSIILFSIFKSIKLENFNIFS
jgi:diguanylate cyclase (GGDEF)-like protein